MFSEYRRETIQKVTTIWINAHKKPSLRDQFHAYQTVRYFLQIFNRNAEIILFVYLKGINFAGLIFRGVDFSDFTI